MNEIIPNLWLGDLGDAQNVDRLKEAQIGYVLSVMWHPPSALRNSKARRSVPHISSV